MPVLIKFKAALLVNEIAAATKAVAAAKGSAKDDAKAVLAGFEAEQKEINKKTTGTPAEQEAGEKAKMPTVMSNFFSRHADVVAEAAAEKDEKKKKALEVIAQDLQELHDAAAWCNVNGNGKP